MISCFYLKDVSNSRNEVTFEAAGIIHIRHATRGRSSTLEISAGRPLSSVKIEEER